MVLGPFTRVRALVFAALVALAALGCGARDLGAVADGEGIPAAGLVRLSDSTAVAARNRDGLVELLWFEDKGGGWSSQVIGSHQTSERASGQLIAYGGDTDSAWNSFFYGAAQPTASQMNVERPDTEGGQVVDGAWVVAIRAKDVAPSLPWKLLDASGNTMNTGSGPFPAIR